MQGVNLDIGWVITARCESPLVLFTGMATSLGGLSFSPVNPLGLFSLLQKQKRGEEEGSRTHVARGTPRGLTSFCLTTLSCSVHTNEAVVSDRATPDTSQVTKLTTRSAAPFNGR